jgi:leader peptidase (prepilin peptidase)/N-methyltransferase
VAVELFVGLVYFLTTSFFIKNYFGIYTSIPGWFFVWMFLLLIIVSYGALMVVYDIQTKTVPLVWFIGLVFFSGIYVTIPYISGAASALSVWRTIGFHVSGILVMLPFLAMWIVSRGKWMGFADIQIIAWIGMFFGVQTGASAVLLSFYLGSIFGIGFIIYKLIKRIPYSNIRKIHIPFVPFLFLGWFITLIYNFDIITLLSGLFI